MGEHLSICLPESRSLFSRGQTTNSKYVSISTGFPSISLLLQSVTPYARGLTFVTVHTVNNQLSKLLDH